MTRLFHYTCQHAALGIRSTGKVQPQPQPVLEGAFLSWWTDLDVPHREALGLTSLTLKCDRTECRFEAADTSQITRWTAVRHLPRGAAALERAPGAMPAHWWIAGKPVPVLPTEQPLTHHTGLAAFLAGGGS